jgi:hypothetical protein
LRRDHHLGQTVEQLPSPAALGRDGEEIVDLGGAGDRQHLNASSTQIVDQAQNGHRISRLAPDIGRDLEHLGAALLELLSQLRVRTTIQLDQHRSAAQVHVGQRGHHLAAGVRRRRLEIDAHPRSAQRRDGFGAAGHDLLPSQAVEDVGQSVVAARAFEDRLDANAGQENDHVDGVAAQLLDRQRDRLGLGVVLLAQTRHGVRRPAVAGDQAGHLRAAPGLEEGDHAALEIVVRHTPWHSL